MEVMFLITWQRYDLIVLLEIEQTNSACLLGLVYLSVELCLGKVLDELGRSRHPIRSLSSSHSIKEEWYHYADDQAHAATLHHFVVAEYHCQKHD